MSAPVDSLENLRGRDAALPVSPAAKRAADAATQRFGESARAVIFYGSCLRDGREEDRIFDFYVIVDSYRRAYGPGLMAAANRLLPPNVFYMETEGEGAEPLRAKVAVVSLADLRRLTSSRAFNSTLWARLAQPARLPFAADGADARAVAVALAESLRSLAKAVLPLLPADFTSRQFWVAAFAQTYRAELRAEKTKKGAEIYDLNSAYFDRALASLAADADMPIHVGEAEGRYRHAVSSGRRRMAAMAWALRRVQGKSLSLARLIKAAFTFEGGADYIVWKIRRHSGVEITLTPWQRRHPVIAGLMLFSRLWRRRAFR